MGRVKTKKVLVFVFPVDAIYAKTTSLFVLDKATHTKTIHKCDMIQSFKVAFKSLTSSLTNPSFDLFNALFVPFCVLSDIVCVWIIRVMIVHGQHLQFFWCFLFALSLRLKFGNVKSTQQPNTPRSGCVRILFHVDKVYTDLDLSLATMQSTQIPTYRDAKCHRYGRYICEQILEDLPLVIMQSTQFPT